MKSINQIAKQFSLKIIQYVSDKNTARSSTITTPSGSLKLAPPYTFVLASCKKLIWSCYFGTQGIGYICWTSPAARIDALIPRATPLPKFLLIPRLTMGPAHTCIHPTSTFVLTLCKWVNCWTKLV